MPRHPVPVTVLSADPLSRAGAVGLLRHEQSVDVVDPPRADSTSDPDRPAVAILLAVGLDEPTVADLRRVSRGERRVVLVVEKLREPELMTVLECGVRAVLWRNAVTSSALSTAVRAAARGETVLPPDLLDQLVTQVARGQRAATLRGTSAAAPLGGLDARETDVLRLLGEGLETREIAEKLAYSERTIKSVLHGIMGRLQLRSRAHAVAFALREGYI